MKFLKNKKYEETTIRKVVNDEKTVVIGIVGTVGDMLKIGLLEECDGNPNDWCFLSKDGKAKFAPTRQWATAHLN